MSTNIMITVPLEKRLLVEAYLAGGEFRLDDLQEHLDMTLADDASLSPDARASVLRALVGFDLLDPVDSGCYRLTSLGAYIARHLSARMENLNMEVH